MHLYWSGFGLGSQGQLYQAPVSKNFLTSAIVSGFGVRWIPRWGSPSVSTLLFVPTFPFDRRNSGVIYLRWVGGSVPQLGAVPVWSLQVLSTPCWVFQLKSSLMGPGNLLGPWHLRLSSGYPAPSPRTATYQLSHSWPSVLLPHLGSAS